MINNKHIIDRLNTVLSKSHAVLVLAFQYGGYIDSRLNNYWTTIGQLLSNYWNPSLKPTSWCVEVFSLVHTIRNLQICAIFWHQNHKGSSPNQRLELPWLPSLGHKNLPKETPVSGQDSTPYDLDIKKWANDLRTPNSMDQRESLDTSGSWPVPLII